MVLLDGMTLFELTMDDKAFLERFSNLKTLLMNKCCLKSL